LTEKAQVVRLELDLSPQRNLCQTSVWRLNIIRVGFSMVGDLVLLHRKQLCITDQAGKLPCFPLSAENYSFVPLKILYDLNFPISLKGLSHW